MSVKELLVILRRRGGWVVTALLIGLGAAAAAWTLTPKQFASSTSLYVTATDSSSAAALSQGAQYVQSQIRSYPMLLTSPAVLQAAANELGLPQDGSLASAISSEVPTDSALLNITATAGTPDQAAALASSVAKHFSTEVVKLETRADNATSPIRLDVVAPAAVPAQPIAPSLSRYLLVGGFGGLLVGIALAAARERLARLR